MPSVTGKAAPMNEQHSNKRAIQNLIEEVWRKGEIDAPPKYWTVNCLNHADPSPEKLGLAAVQLYHKGFALWFADFDQINIDVKQQIAEADSVVTQMLLTALHKLTGRRISLSTIRIDRMEKGKIAEHWSVADIAGLMKQLG